MRLSKMKQAWDNFVSGGYPESSQTLPVDMGQYSGSEEDRVKMIDMIVRLAWMEACGSYGYTPAIRKRLEENFLRGKQAYEYVPFSSFLLDGRAKWAFEYYHKAENKDPLSWHKWYKLPEKERDNWYPFIQYGIKSDTTGRDIVNAVRDWNETDDRQFVKTFHTAFWDMAGVFLGMKLDKDKETFQLKVPKCKNGVIPLTRIGIEGKEGMPSMTIGLDLSLEKMKKLMEDDSELYDEFIVAISKAANQLNSALKASSRFTLSQEDQTPTGPKKTDYDLLKEAFEWVEANVADCRKGYAKDGKAMVDRMQQQEKTIPALIASMELTGDYEAVLARYQELKKQPESDKKDKGKGKGNGNGKDNDKGSSNKDSKGSNGSNESGLVKTYRNLQTKYGDQASAQTPTRWDSTLTGQPEFKEARKEDGPLSQLDYRKYTIFEIATEYVLHTGKPLPKWLAALCDAEVRRIKAKYGKADDSDDSDDSDGE